MACFFRVIIVLCCSLSVNAQDVFQHTVTHLEAPGSAPREHPVDMQHVRLDVNFEPHQGLVKGKVVHTFRVLQRVVDSIQFDAIKINIKQVLLGGKPTRYAVRDSIVTVYCEPPLTWDSTETVQFTFEARPRKGLFFVGWSDTTGTMRRQIWTQGQATDHRHWFPLYDDANDKLITETIVTFDSSYTVISNGERRSVRTNGDGSRTWHYAMTKPHAAYLLMLAIGKYDLTRDTTASGIPLEMYWYPDRPHDAEPTYRYSRESFDWLEQNIGVAYPWGVYRQVPAADYVYGAMENTTATIFGDFYLTDARGWLDRSYVNTNVHELTHQWFGDLVTARSLRDLWLQESFATFYPLQFSRKVRGDDEYQWSRRGMQNQALQAGERDRFPIVHVKAGGSRVYPKGALVLDMMCTTFGEEEMRRVIRHYLQKHAFGNVETNDLYQAFQDTLGLSPNWFFDQWLYRSGEPHFSIQVSTGTRTDLKGTEQVTTLLVRQVHHMDELTGPFRVPVVCEAYYTDGSKDSVRVWLHGPTDVVHIPNPEGRELDFVLFDPGSTLLKRVSWQKTWEQLTSQLAKAPYMIDRYDALVEIGKDTAHQNEKMDAFAAVLNKEQHYAMRAEAVQLAAGLADKGLEKAWTLVERGLSDRHVEVRKRTLNALPMIPERLRQSAESLLADSSYAVIESALYRLCRSFPERIGEYVNRTRDLTSPHAQVEIARAEIMAENGISGAAALEVLSDYCSNRYEAGVRRNAFQALVRLGTAPQKALEGIIDASSSPNWRLADAARDTLAKLSTQSKIKEAIRVTSSRMKLDKETRQSVETLSR